jgi:hypothetical protein
VAIAAPPILEGFDGEVERGRALAVAHRLGEASGGRVMEIRRVTPADYLVQLEADGRDGVLGIHVDPQGSAAEKAWCAAIAKGSPMRQWADLRWPDRMVIGGVQ